MNDSEIIDTLQTPRFAPRLSAAPIPSAAWNEEPTRCLKVNAEWVSHLLGVIECLDQPDTWVGTEAEIEAARVNVNEIMAALSTDHCEEPMAQFRIDGCDLQTRNGDDEDWTTLGNVCGADGADGHDGVDGADGRDGVDGTNGLDGTDGLPGEPGVKGDCCGTDDVEVPTDTSNGTFCGMATYFVHWFNESWTDWLQTTQAAADTAEAVADAVEAIPGVGLILSPFTSAIQALASLSDATIDTYLAEVTTGKLDEFQCALYCDLKAAGTYNVGIVRDWAQNIIDTSGLELGVRTWGAFVNGITDAEITKRISVGGAVPLEDCDELCDECPDDNEFCGADWVIVDDRQDLPTYDSDAKTISGPATLIFGNYYWGVKVPFGSCCTVEAVITGDVTVKFRAGCDYTGDLSLDEGTGWTTEGLNISGNYRGVLIRSSGPFSVVLGFSA